MNLSQHIAVIDPAVKVAELRCFNHLTQLSKIPLTYHLPAFFGQDSLESEPSNLAGIIVLGSASSVYDGLPWQKPLEDWLKPRLEAGTPALGLCYGHQLFAHLFGGKVAFVTPEKKKFTGFRDIEFAPNRLWNHQALKGAVYVTHNEHVVNVPTGFEVCGRSADIAIDGLSHSSLPIWSFQSHPEAISSFPKEAEWQKPENAARFHFGHSLVKRFLNFAEERAR